MVARHLELTNNLAHSRIPTVELELSVVLGRAHGTQFKDSDGVMEAKGLVLETVELLPALREGSVLPMIPFPDTGVERKSNPRAVPNFDYSDMIDNLHGYLN
ncbi:MAG: hypothetical protein M1816_004316 [Peltula sp. TS41687]|nr:MAG: hypothetical protein M1816_004316 [Peltula sp. TS41687]